MSLHSLTRTCFNFASITVQKKIPESYAFVVMKNKLVYDNALAKDMRVLGVQVAVSQSKTTKYRNLLMLISIIFASYRGLWCILVMSRT